MTLVDVPLTVAHASGLHAVERGLAEMHREMLRAGGRADGGVVRLSVLNLVAACVDVASADLATQAVGRIGAKHPARAIIILASPDGPAKLEADLSLQCSDAEAGRVCAEQVRLDVGGEIAYHLASVVTPLLVPDIPVYLWLVGSPPLRQAFGQDAIAICEKLIIDSGEYDDHAGTLRLLAGELAGIGDAVALSDIAWTRSVPFRQLIAQSFDGETMRHFLRGIVAVEIECSGDRVSAQTWLLAGWMASRLGWRAGDARPRLRVTARPVDDVADHDLVRVALRCEADGQRARVVVERRGASLHSAIEVDGGVRAERAVPVSVVDTIDLVGSLLETANDDPVYRVALVRAAELAGAAG